MQKLHHGITVYWYMREH